MSANDTPYTRLDRRLERSIQDLPLRVLQALVDRPGSARQLGHVLDEDPQEVLAHLVDLWEDGCIELAPGVQPEDSLDRRYRVLSSYFEDSDWATLSKADREALSATALQVIFTESMLALKTGSFDARTDRHLSWKRLRLDDAGWRELASVLRRTVSEVEAVHDRSRGRLVSSGEAGVEAIVALVSFERGDPVDS
ncbi:MAG TPA: hypothetical protein VHF50_03860 [Solirubrobacterales bacterium]|nr:hypothetical protein [Solirubrobacterales bacterium]